MHVRSIKHISPPHFALLLLRGSFFIFISAPPHFYSRFFSVRLYTRSSFECNASANLMDRPAIYTAAAAAVARHARRSRGAKCERHTIDADRCEKFSSKISSAAWRVPIIEQANDKNILLRLLFFTLISVKNVYNITRRAKLVFIHWICEFAGLMLIISWLL